VTGCDGGWTARGAVSGWTSGARDNGFATTGSGLSTAGRSSGYCESAELRTCGPGVGATAGPDVTCEYRFHASSIRPMASCPLIYGIDRAAVLTAAGFRAWMNAQRIDRSASDNPANRGASAERAACGGCVSTRSETMARPALRIASRCPEWGTRLRKYGWRPRKQAHPKSEMVQ
jgi:hypothetical protein